MPYLRTMSVEIASSEAIDQLGRGGPLLGETQTEVAERLDDVKGVVFVEVERKPAQLFGGEKKAIGAHKRTR